MIRAMVDPVEGWQVTVEPHPEHHGLAYRILRNGHHVPGYPEWSAHPIDVKFILGAEVHARLIEGLVQETPRRPVRSTQ